MSEYRSMRHKAVREEARRRRYESHIEPLNRLVDELRQTGRGWMPYVDARYGGAEAQVLFLFQDPGPRTVEHAGSGFLSPQNDDPSAERFLRCLNAVGLPVDHVVTWNAYPWVVPPGQSRTVALFDEGRDALIQVLGCLPKLKVVMAMGRHAQAAWRRLARHQPLLVAPYHVLESFHTSGLGITNGSRQSADEGEADLCRAMREALTLIGD